MTETDVKNNWYYFKSLTKQLSDTEQYVDHSINKEGNMANSDTFSNEFAKILMLASSEFEVIAKALCEVSGKKLRWNANIIAITKTIRDAYPHIGETEITTPYLIIKPLYGWGTMKDIRLIGNTKEIVTGISWWEAHNQIKHNRRDFFQTANLNNCVYSLAALMVLELYLSQKVIGNIDMLKSIGCYYYDCKYGPDNLVVNPGNVLPDFDI